MATMKALQITQVHESQLITLDRPEPGPNEVLINVMASGICGTDIHFGGKIGVIRHTRDCFI